MPLYENTEGTSNRFWEITLTGKSFTTRWGKTGTQGQEKKQRFSTTGEARHAYDKRISEKRKKGYALANGQEEPGESTSGRVRRNPKLEARIAKEPNNLKGYLVYGDWLREQGDPRGELIALQCAAHQASGKEATKLKKQASALVREYKQFLLGELADKGDNDVTLEWRFGFIRSARLARGDFASKLDVAKAVGALMKLPSARFLRELTLGMADFSENDYGEAIKALAETPCPTLERLFIGDFESPTDEIYLTNLRNISPLYKALPGLRALKLRGTWLELGSMNLPKLQEFTIESNSLPRRAVRSIVNAKWPKLERLEVWFGTPTLFGSQDSVECGEREVALLLNGKGLTKLKHLGLRNTRFTGALCEALSGAKVLHRLESLDLSTCMLMDEEAAALARHAAAFKRLKHLDVSRNFLSGEGEKLMATLCASVATGPQNWSEDEHAHYYEALEE